MWTVVSSVCRRSVVGYTVVGMAPSSGISGTSRPQPKGCSGVQAGATPIYKCRFMAVDSRRDFSRFVRVADGKERRGEVTYF